MLSSACERDSVKIAIASDHAGFTRKQEIATHLESEGHCVVDFGTDSTAPVDYPDFIRPAAQSVADGNTDLAIVLGGSGNGEAMVANKVEGVSCALCWTEDIARLAKEHNNANAISIGERMVDHAEAIKIVDAWLKAEFQAGRHLRRVKNWGQVLQCNILNSGNTLLNSNQKMHGT